MRPALIDDSFRPWATAGITAFLADEDIFLAVQAPPAPGGRAGQPDFADQAQSANQPVGQTRHTPDRFRPHHPEQRARATSPVQAPAQPPVPAGIAPGHDSRAQRQTPAMPQAFAARFASLGPAPVLWTYAHLGADLCGQGSAERSAFLRSVIQNLRLPKGTSVFWPFSFPENTPGAGTQEEGFAAFRQGIGAVEPKFLIFIGNDALAPMDGRVDLRLPFTQKLFQGRLHLLLPDFGTLLQTPALFEQTNSFLRALFTAHGVLPGGR